MDEASSNSDSNKECDSMGVFDLILSDNFQKENESDFSNYNSDITSNSSILPRVQSSSSELLQTDENLLNTSEDNSDQLYDIIERDNFHVDEKCEEQNISDTILSNLKDDVLCFNLKSEIIDNDVKESTEILDGISKSINNIQISDETTDDNIEIVDHSNSIGKTINTVDEHKDETNETKNETTDPVVETEEIIDPNEKDVKANEEYLTLINYIEDTKQRLKTKAESRKNNLIPVRNEFKLSKLDSTLKKNSAFVKKLKNFTSQQLDSLIKDLSLLNLTKYMSEVTSALVEVKLKLTDISYVLVLCSELHKVYSDFSKLFFEQWSKSLPTKKDDKNINASKLRVDLRFYGDLIINGIFQNKEAFSLLGNVLTVLMSSDKDDHNNLNIIISFCKYCGEDYAGLVPKHIQDLAIKYDMEIPKSDLLPQEKQKNVKLLLNEYFQSLCKHIQKDSNELNNFEKQNERILQSKGELRQERKDQFEQLMSCLKKLTQSAETFAEIIGETLPEIAKHKCVSEETTIGNVISVCGTESEDGGNVNFNSIWDDEEMQSFYQDIPYLKDFLPHLKVKVSSSNDGEEPWRSKSGTPTAEEISEETIDQEMNKLTQEDANKEPTVPNEESEGPTEGTPQEEPVVATTPSAPDVVLSNIKAGATAGIDTYLANLYKCENREMIDNAAIEFIMYHNTKTSRKKLTNTLLFVPRTRIDLLPFLSRFVAILHPFQPDIGNDLTSMLKNDFKYHTKKKDQINIESKIKNVRYIGELVKFKLYSKIEVLYCLKVLLTDFAHHHVEMCCHLLETCGRYLYRNKDTHPRIKIYLEQMMRKRTVLNLDPRYNMMIENAFYYVNPPEVAISKRKDKPDIVLFVEKMLYIDLMNVADKDRVAKVLNYLLKLNWNDEAVGRYTVRALTQVWNVKYDWIKILANVLAGLVEYHEDVGVQVVDNVLEDIRICLEINHPKLNQRRLSVVKYLGELYNYRLIESNDVFKVLYSLISFGVYYSQDMDPTTDPYNYLDPPDNLFRIKLVCVLLETCGQYFSHGITRTKLDFFFVFFQNYFWYKLSHPIWKNKNDVFSINIRNYFREILITLRPNIKLCKNFNEAKKLCKELQNKLLNKIKPLNDITNQIHTIQEEDDPVDELENGSGDYKVDKRRDRERRSGDSEPDGRNDEVEQINNMDEKTEKISKIEKYTDSELNENSETLCDKIETSVDDEDANEISDNTNMEEDKQLNEDDSYDDQLDISDIVDGIEDKLYDQYNDNEDLEQEEDDFVNEFDKMMSDNLQERIKDVNVQKNKFTIPVNFRTKKSYLEETSEDCISFTLMVRNKSNKQQYKPLVVPRTSDLVLNLKTQEKAEKDEMDYVKQLTLNISDRLEEDGYSDDIENNRNLNRHSHSKHQTHKAPYTPDADLIFGKSKKSHYTYK